MLYPSHPFFQTFRKLMADISAHEPILDLGTSGRFAKEMKFVEPLFAGKDYRAGGFNPDTRIEHPCDFHCDVQDLNTIASGSAGAVISLEVLEHVQDPVACVREAFRVLRPGGVCLLSTPFMTGYHGKTKKSGSSGDAQSNDHASYSDYWRFTHEGLEHLFRSAGFRSVTVYAVDGPITARLEICKLGGFLKRLPWMARLIWNRERPTPGKLTTRHVVFAQKENDHG